MKRIFILSIFICSLHASAQNHCNAAFSYSLNYDYVTFTTSDSIAHGTSIWRFGDGNSESSYWSSNVSHRYASSGIYSVVHIVVDSTNSCRDSVVQTVNVNFQVSCSSSFAYYRDSTNFSHYTFLDASTTIGTYSNAYIWSINGVQVSTNASFQYVFPQIGTYHVCQQLQTSPTCSSSSCQDVIVNSIDSCKLSATFLYKENSSNPLEIEFHTIQDTLSNASYFWDFGGVYDTSKAPTHIFSKGIYNVNVYVNQPFENGSTCSAYASSVVYVNIGPADTCSANFTYSTNQRKPNTISFIASSGQPIQTQTWSIAKYYPFYDSAYFKGVDSSQIKQINASNPNYTFPDTGLYTIQVKVTTQAGCTVSSAWQNIMIDSVANDTASTNALPQVPAYPNPATNTVNLELGVIGNNIVTINIYSSFGNLLLTKQVSAVDGKNQIAIPVQTLNSGVYYMQINYGNTTKTSRFQKL